MLTPYMVCKAQRWSSSYEDYPDNDDCKDDSGDIDGGYCGDDWKVDAGGIYDDVKDNWWCRWQWTFYIFISVGDDGVGDVDVRDEDHPDDDDGKDDSGGVGGDGGGDGEVKDEDRPDDDNNDVKDEPGGDVKDEDHPDDDDGKDDSGGADGISQSGARE